MPFKGYTASVIVLISLCHYLLTKVINDICLYTIICLSRNDYFTLTLANPMNFIKQQLFFLLLIPFYLSCMESPKTVTKQGKEFIFYKPLSEQSSTITKMKEVGRISSSQYSVANICMLMNIKALPFDIQHRIALLFLGNKIKPCTTFNLSHAFWGFPQQSPDGETILGVSDSHEKGMRMSIVNRTSGDEITSIKGNNACPDCLIVFSPNGKTVFLSQGPQNIYPLQRTGLWNAASGDCLWSLEGIACSAAFSPDGKTIFTGCGYPRALLWDTTTGELLKEFSGHRNQISAVAFSPDGKTILTSSHDGTTRLWDLSGNAIITLQGFGQLPAKEIRFIPNDTTTILVTSGDGIAYLWNNDMGEQPKQLGKLPKEGMIMSPDSKAIVTLSDDDTTACLYDTITGEQLVSFKGHTEKIVSVAMCAEGNYILTGSNDHTARLWDRPSGTELCIFQGHTGPVVSIAISSDGKTIITGSTDTTARIWDTLSSNQLYTLNHQGPMASVAYSSHGKTIITASFPPEEQGLKLTGYVWDATTGQQLKVLLYSTTWKVDLGFKVFETSRNLAEQLTGQVMPIVTTIAIDPNDSSAVIKQRIYLAPGNPTEISMLWSNGYSKAFMSWITTEIRPLQAWLILQLIQADDAGKPFSIEQGSLEDKLLKSIPEDFQKYLIKRYSIEINPEKTSSECSLQ